ncbi:unnamed protein product [Darwinula stevensoni]|uniref:Glutathione S-transferase n=1 Tax=Darwinula stevensoni TaxID=69355 RepID=A0A7R9AHB0_9CRUS|nr:unnamed protein product [Darwinula stevensoni]CAG0904990.1 unnamed protein product [Darwinula stevensoni]
MIDFYYLNPSPFSRSVMLTAKAVGVELNLKVTNFMKGETKTPEYLKMNPQHTIPTIDDDGFYLYESRAIQRYLANKYGKDDSFYPKDPKARAVVDQRLDFDLGTLSNWFIQYILPIPMGKTNAIPEDAKPKLAEIVQFLDGFIEKSGGFVAGDRITIADHAIVAMISSLEAAELMDLSPYENVTAWLSKCKAEMEGYDEACGQGAAQFGAMLKSKLAQ